MQISKERKEKLYLLIPYSALVLLLISFIAGFIPWLKDFAYTNSGRLTGFFQYANTFALYLLLGIVVLTNKKEGKNSYLISAIFFIGIILTGSRTTFVLVLIYFMYLLFSKKNINKKQFAIGSFISLVLLTICFALGTKIALIGRVFNISINSGTLLERFIYWKDALKLIIKNPFGYGYMGYFYKVFAVQTFDYTTKFVHNEYLQMILDIGIIPTIIFITYLVKSVIYKENSSLNKEILIIIMLHMLMDPDLQFIVILYIMLMAFYEKENKEFKVGISISFSILIVAITCVYIYYGLACLFNFINKNDIACKMLNDYTEAKLEVINKTQDLEKAKKMADEILENNKYEPQVYNVNALYYLKKSDYEKMVQNKKKEISLKKYQTQVYEEYILLLSQVIQIYAIKNDEKNLNQYIDYVYDVEKMVQEVKENTSMLANKINNKEILDLDENTKNYIQEMKSLKREDLSK